MKVRNRYLITVVLFVLFAVFTAIVSFVDVRPIGPEGTEVGLSTLNKLVFDGVGVNHVWHKMTDLLGVVAILVALTTAAVGTLQLIKRKSLMKVDCQILLLGAFYVIIAAFYAFFEIVIINYRPIILDASVEASYPSSHTVLVVCVMSAAIAEIRRLLAKKKKLCVILQCASALVIAVTVVGRLLSGVHWFTDIIAGILLSSALVMLYFSTVSFVSEKRSKTE